MIRTALGAAAGLAMALGTLGPTPVRAASDEDIARLLAGLAALAIVGKALSEAREEDRADGARHRPYAYHPRHGGDGAPRLGRHRTVPVECMRVTRTRDGVRRVFLRPCVDSRVRKPWAMPRQCLTRVRTQSGPRQAYVGHCLRRNGFRLARD